MTEPKIYQWYQQTFSIISANLLNNVRFGNSNIIEISQNPISQKLGEIPDSTSKYCKIVAWLQLKRKESFRCENNSPLGPTIELIIFT